MVDAMRWQEERQLSSLACGRGAMGTMLALRGGSASEANGVRQDGQRDAKEDGQEGKQTVGGRGREGGHERQTHAGRLGRH